MSVNLVQFDRVWFTSDPHFGHKSILKYCDRPFNSVEEMDEGLIINWNSKVQKKDITVIVGDFGFGTPSLRLIEILNRLNGKIYHIQGNHDKSITKKLLKQKKVLGSKQIECFKIPDSTQESGFGYVSACHYPMLSWPHKGHGAIHVYGHWHDIDPQYHNSVNVCVDLNNYVPISYDEVKEKAENTRIKHFID